MSSIAKANLFYGILIPNDFMKNEELYENLSNKLSENNIEIVNYGNYHDLSLGIALKKFLVI